VKPQMTRFINLFLLLVSNNGLVVSAFTPTANRVIQSRQSTAIQESFGFDFAENQEENTNPNIFGEANYKQYISEKTENSFLNRQYNLLRRVRELDLLVVTADSEILSKLEKNGVDLKTLEAVLPIIDKLQVVGIAGNFQQLIINGILPLLVETSPLLLPALATLLDIGPIAFFALAGAVGGLEAFFIINKTEIPFVGLSCGFYIGALLVPVTALFALVGIALVVTNSNMDSDDNNILGGFEDVKLPFDLELPNASSASKDEKEGGGLPFDLQLPF